MANVRCCHNCARRCVTEYYNCHDHCKEYAEETAPDPRELLERKTRNNIYGRRTDKVLAARKKHRRH